jgi:predicted nucleic acid-binding Zn ribbon protein
MTEPVPHDSRPMHHCIKCGRAIGPDESMCAVCNRAGMATPSASQYHGTMVLAIIAGVVGLAIWGSLAMRGVGPYDARVVSVVPAPPGAVDVTLEVENRGTARGYAKCQLQALDASDRVVRVQPMQAGPLEGGATQTVTEHFPGLAEVPQTVAVDCR